MSIDSTAELLFHISADASDATANIARFRTLLGKDLSDLTGEFDAWSTKLLGNLSTVKGALIATGTLTGAGLVAVAGFAVEAAHKYSAYVDEIAKGSRTTGISVENMSRLKFAADATHTSYESLVSGLTRFTVGVVKSTQDWETHGAAFRALNITQEQVKAGEKDLNGLLMIVADRFHELGSRVMATAEARELFARGGARLVQMLSQGSAGLREMGAEAERLGLVIGTKDVEANEAYRASIHLMKAEIQGFVMTIGKDVLPVLTTGIADMLGMALGVRDALKNVGWVDAITLGNATIVKMGMYGRQEADALKVKIGELAKSLSKFGNDAGTDLVAPAKAAKEEWSGLTDLLEKVKERTEDLSSIDQKQAQELEKIGIEVAKATAKYEALRKAGKLSPEDAAAQAAALAQWNDAVGALIVHYDALVVAKNKAAGEKLGDETAAQAEQTYAVKSAAWDREIEKQADDLRRAGALNDENQNLLFTKWVAGHDKLDREQSAAVKKAGEDLDALMGAQREKTYAEQVAGWEREIAGRREEYVKLGTLDAANLLRLAATEAAGRDKIDRERSAAYTAEVAKLSTHLASLVTQQMTHADKLRVTYERDVLAYSEAELEKTVAMKGGEFARVEAEQMFAKLRKMLLTGYQTDLQALQNSQGWQGVFGSKFGALLKGDEALMKEWATSSNQSLLMVKVSLENMKEMGRQAFGQLADGMGAGIASSLIYSKSVGAAMRAASTSTLESIASQSLAYAIYSLGLGFMRVAERDPVGADAAFTAAAIYGTVGAAAAVIGRAVAPAQAGSTAAAGAGGSAAGSGAAAGAGAGGAAAGQGYNLTVNVLGNAYGVDSLIDAVNEAVRERDKMLTATNTTTGQVIYR